MRVIHEELVRVMGEGVRPLNLRTQPPAIILLAGLQGAGKTTTAAKIALWLKERERKRVLLVSTDVYRPAAMLQLERLGQQLGIDVAASDPGQAPARDRDAARWRRPVAASTTCCWWTPPAGCTSTTR